jgi:hypothetical protein
MFRIRRRKMKEKWTHERFLPKKCKAELDDDGVCGENIEHIHSMYRSMGFCEKHWCENADALWEEFCMTREACR